MQRLGTGTHPNKGFTLIEMLVVLFIIGISLSFVFLAFGDFGKSRRLKMAAEQLVNSLHLAEQQAVLTQTPIGIKITTAGYAFFYFNAAKHWQPLLKPSPFKTQSFPAHTLIRLISNLPPDPSIIINSNGEVTPFFLSLGTEKNPEIVSVEYTARKPIHLKTGAAE